MGGGEYGENSDFYAKISKVFFSLHKWESAELLLFWGICWLENMTKGVAPSPLSVNPWRWENILRQYSTSRFFLQKTKNKNKYLWR